MKKREGEKGRKGENRGKEKREEKGRKGRKGEKREKKGKINGNGNGNVISGHGRWRASGEGTSRKRTAEELNKAQQWCTHLRQCTTRTEGHNGGDTHTKKHMIDDL